jgi:hypothetical protein
LTGTASTLILIVIIIEVVARGVRAAEVVSICKESKQIRGKGKHTRVSHDCEEDHTEKQEKHRRMHPVGVKMRTVP